MEGCRCAITPGMKIRYRRSGGLAGLLQGLDLNLDTLSPAEGDRVRAWVVDAMRATARSARVANPARDTFQRSLEIETGGKTTRLDLRTEGAWRDLVHWLDAKAVPMARK